MRELNKIAEALFEKVRDRFEDVSLGDENAKSTQNPENARFFNFDYTVDGKSHGNITLSIIDEISLKVYFSKNISQELEGEERQKWYAFLKELREFARRNILSFEPRDITRSTLKHRDVEQQSKADSTYTKDEVIGEGRMYGTHKSSYERDGNVKLIVRHTEAVNPEQRGARSRKIKSIFVETSEGERIKLPHNNLRYARAMARHVSEGGQLADDFGQHITRIAEECGKLRPFKSQMVRRTFEDQETQAMVEAAFEYHALLNNTLKRMGGRKGYSACKESFKQDEQLMDDVDINSLRERFVKRTYNERMDDALPIVQKAYEMKKSNKFAEQFENWANNVAESYDDSIDVDELAELFADELPVGVDAINAINAVSGIITNDELENALTQAAQQNPEADARDVMISWLADNEPEVYQELMNEIGDADTADGGMDEPNVNEEHDEDTYNDDNVEAIQTAILRRILGDIGQHGELLRAVGPEGVMNAAREVAHSHAPVDELGSSDVSNMVREVYQEAGVEFPELNEGRVKELEMDLEELTDAEFVAKYNKTKAQMRAGLSEGQGLTEASEWETRHDEFVTVGDRISPEQIDKIINALDLAAKQANSKQGFLNQIIGKQSNGELARMAYAAERHAKNIQRNRNAKPGTDERKELGQHLVYAMSLLKRIQGEQDVAEGQGDDHVNRDEKLKRAGAKPLGMMDKLKNIPRGMKAMAKGDSEDDLVLYNKSKQTTEDLAEMRRLAGLK